jgi:ribosome-binding protein aMBF1 (putative translation factor)
MTNGKKSAQAKKQRKVDLATPRALLRKHARIKKNGRVELKKGWSDKKIAKEANAEVELVRRLRGDLYTRIRVEVVREPHIRE